MRLSLTLLILDLKIPKTPEATNVELLADLFNQIPNFLAYLISFFVIVSFWMRNHWILKPLTKANETVFWLTLLHVFFLSLIPFTSSLIGHYEQDYLAVIVFSGSARIGRFVIAVIHRLYRSTNRMA